jgi:hypothetical protein
LHIASYKRGIVCAVYVLAVKLKVEVKLEDLFLKPILISIVEVRPSNLVVASLSFIRGVY